MNKENMRQTTPKYETTSNRILRKPKAKKGVVYSILDPECFIIRGGVFDPIWDTTDHFHFICQECQCVADILQVKLLFPYARDVCFALYFYLGCPACGSTGQRKIYLDRRDSAGIFQSTYINGELLVYGRERQPVHRVRMVGENQRSSHD